MNFPQFDPEESGRVEKLPVPLTAYLSASFDQGYDDSAWASIMRMSELHLDNVDPTSPMLTADEANAKYGVGNLKFSTPIRETAASTMNARKKAEMDRQFTLANGASSGRFIPGMAASLLGATLNPVDLGLMFVPFVGEERLAAGVAKAGGGTFRQLLARGLISSEMLERTVPAPKFVGSAITGMAYVAVDQVPNLVSSMQDQKDFGRGDYLSAIAGQAVFAGIIHAIKPTLQGLAKVFDRLDQSTKVTMMKEAVNQFLKDESIRVDKYVSIDESAIRARVGFDEARVKAEALENIDDQKLKDAIFEKWHEEPKAAAVMTEDGTVYTGSFHSEAWSKVPEDLAAKGGTEGFVTASGRFVSRDEAARMMGIKEYLTAETMWDGVSDPDWLSHDERVAFDHMKENGLTDAEAINKVRAIRIKRTKQFFFERPDIQEKVEAERTRQTNEFIEKARQDSERRFTEEKQKEIERQIAEGKTMKPEEVEANSHPETFDGSSDAKIDEDIKALEENLGIKDQKPKPQIDVWYHGTSSKKFKKFKKGGSSGVGGMGSDSGHFFTRSKTEAAYYIDLLEQMNGTQYNEHGDSHIVKAQLSGKKIIVDFTGIMDEKIAERKIQTLFEENPDVDYIVLTNVEQTMPNRGGTWAVHRNPEKISILEHTSREEASLLTHSGSDNSIDYIRSLNESSDPVEPGGLVLPEHDPAIESINSAVDCLIKKIV